MIGKPKYKVDDKVSFSIYLNDNDIQTFEGIVVIVDKYGVFEDDSDVHYDILVNYNGNDTIFKHIKETMIIE